MLKCIFLNLENMDKSDEKLLVQNLKRLLLESEDFNDKKQFQDLLLDIEVLIDNYETKKTYN